MIKIKFVRQLRIDFGQHNTPKEYEDRDLYKYISYPHPPSWGMNFDLGRGINFHVKIVVQKKDGTFIVYQDSNFSNYSPQNMLKYEKKLLEQGWII